MTTAPSIEAIFDHFSKKKVLIVGDVMVDAYLWGNVERISPESPVPIVEINETEDRLGGAANVALNVKALDAEPILCSVIGEDREGQIFKKLLSEKDLSDEGIIISDERPTTVKSRILCRNHQMLRFDREIISGISPTLERKLIAAVEKILNNHHIDVVIIQDYNKGVLTPEVIRGVISAATARNIPVVVDPKKKNFLEYKNVALFKPNLRELADGLNIDLNKADRTSLNEASSILKSKINNAFTMITLSESGIYYDDGNVQQILPAHVRNISDVSGAGDTVISVAALAISANLSSYLIAELANLAGGLVCEEVGVIPVDKQKLMDEAKNSLRDKSQHFTS